MKAFRLILCCMVIGVVLGTLAVQAMGRPRPMRMRAPGHIGIAKDFQEVDGVHRSPVPGRLGIRVKASIDGVPYHDDYTWRVRVTSPDGAVHWDEVYHDRRFRVRKGLKAMAPFADVIEMLPGVYRVEARLMDGTGATVALEAWRAEVRGE